MNVYYFCATRTTVSRNCCFFKKPMLFLESLKKNSKAITSGEISKIDGTRTSPVKIET